ncbi:DUF2309 domain-containing protein [Haloferax sp. Atlit-10N]|uniref:DUF2309 domain-containing protein n=1 Tax=unclassified Haloferax TaxID=2625095 RepID=UPI000E254E9F|nr:MULTISPECIES: DUF2309 domain-containing protein [unclassified Haloferax]RDZ44608.1 DUF2309 domain-containing protein [Haloferax sp. Atlit-16N]RDZ47961.1 DUF2309 domain-containing protein [Haloferax sp. Atlit-19N]RDZ59612.1 DUF2309 domain-containing protein [Haloferax sp. Atlit-10N]
MSTEHTIEDSIDKAATTVGSVWPIHSFVTANPLSGFEDMPFHEAVTQAADLVGGRGYPTPETFRAALDDGQIDPDVLASELADRGYEDDPETLLERMDAGVESEPSDAETDANTDTARVDRVLTKWLSAFLDEGQAHWPMPNREDGFYSAFRSMAAYDGQIPDDGIVADLPESPVETVEAALESYPQGQWVPIFEEQLAALPGWTGFIKQRAADGGEWQSTHPITLEGYLAARLALLDAFSVDVEPSTGPETPKADAADELADAFLSAWEASYRGEVVDRVAAESEALDDSDSAGRPDAQLVFCIDTRSEVIRRHIEDTGDYETHGYAGFFGIPMEYLGYDADVAVDACPPILDPQHHVSEVPTDRETKASHDRWSNLRETAGEVIESLKTNPATAFGFVESAGSGYGLALAARTLVPGRVSDLLGTADDAVPDNHEFCDQAVHRQHSYVGDLPVGLTDEEKVEYAANAFGLMGWEEFGRLVVFTGHASETANNPFDSSLDCGACAGNPGGPNARVLAAICNDETVKAELRDRGFDIPEDTVFVAGEHNTTTDEIDLFDGDVPESHADDLDQLRADLAVARENATAERAESMGADGSAGVRETERRAADWAETRPEWGLAGNAGFVIGPRELTSDLDLDGRAFLHSYDHSTDSDGDALEAILTGPMVVTQWINAQYYFSTVDNAVYGSGSKVTQNPVGNVGVYQGNGGDLMTGLPLQSLMAADDRPYHQPLRLSTIIHAPVDRVSDVLADHEELTELLDNDWLSLTVVDPTQDHRAFHYEEELTWTPASEQIAAEVEARPESPNAPAVADD